MIISANGYAQVDSLSHPGYIRETVLEASPNMPPLNLRLSGSYPNPFGGSPKNVVNGPSGPLFFNVTAEGDLITRDWDSLKVFQLDEKSWMTFQPPCNSFGFVHKCIPGPNGELYVYFEENRDIQNMTISWKLVKYLLQGNGYAIDSNFAILRQSSAKFEQTPHYIFISPDNYIYLISQSQVMSSGGESEVFNSSGRYISNTKAWCNLNNGIRFYPNSFQEKDLIWYAELTNPDDGTVIFPGKIRSREIDTNNLKCTTDNSIIWLMPSSGKVPLNDSLYLATEGYYAFIINSISGDSFRIEPYSECVRDDYRFHNAGPMAANFDGDIYCFVVYFNTPGKITGDEKIVLYRWRKI